MYDGVFKTFGRLPSRLFAVATLLALTACELNEFKAQEAKLRPLVQRGASKQEVIGLLGSNFVYSSKEERIQLAQFLVNIGVRSQHSTIRIDLAEAARRGGLLRHVQTIAYGAGWRVVSRDGARNGTASDLRG